MSQSTDKFMSVELEFIDPTAHGFISWLDFDTGEPLATLGLGSTAKDIQVDGDGNQVGVDNGGAKFLEWNLQGVDFIKITGGSIQFDEQRSLVVDSTRDVVVVDDFGDENIVVENYNPAQIRLNTADYSDYEPANVIYTPLPETAFEDQDERYQELYTIKQRYTDNTNGMSIEHENAIVFSNPVSKRLLGVMDMVEESFGWYGGFSLGDPVPDSYFEIKRTQEEKLNFTINASTGFTPELGFKYEDVLLWSVKVDGNDFHIKNQNGYGIELLNNEDATVFTGEVYYHEQLLDDRFVNVGGDIMTGNLEAQLFVGDLQGNSDTTTQLQSPINITLQGDVDDTIVSFDGSTDIVIDVVVKNDSHTHNNSYYTRDELDAKINVLEEVDNTNPVFPNDASPGTMVYSKYNGIALGETEASIYINVAPGQWIKFTSNELIEDYLK